MNVLIDTNIILDIFFKREGLFLSSYKMFELAREEAAQLYITANAVTDINYLLRKEIKHSEVVYNHLDTLLSFCGIIPVTGSDIIEAIHLKARDFEDALVFVCAKNYHCDCIVTRNTKDFNHFDFHIFTPEDFITKFNTH